MHDGFSALKGALLRFDLIFGDGAAAAKAAELLQAGCDNFGQVRLLVAVGNLDRFFQLASFNAPATLGANSRDCLRAALRIKLAVDDHSQRPDRLDEEDDDDALGKPSHVVP